MKSFKPSLIVYAVWALMLMGPIPVITSDVHAESSTHDHGQKKTAVYYCPMHPSYTSDRPGTCPICHMDLVTDEADSAAGANADEPKIMTVEQLKNLKPGEVCLLHKCSSGTCLIAMSDEFARLKKCPSCGEDLNIILKDWVPEGYGAVKLSEEKRQIIGIKTAKAVRSELKKTIRAVGTIAHDPDLYEAQAEYIQSLKSLAQAEGGSNPQLKEQAQSLAQSSRMRLAHLGLSEDLIEETSRMTSPDSSLLYATAGQSVWLYARIYEYELPFVKPGQSVRVEIPSLGRGGEYGLGGVIKSVDNSVNPETRTVQVRAQIPNPEGILKPDMFVNAVLEADLGHKLLIPREAVFDTGKQQIVFVDRGQGLLEPRSVLTGAGTETQVEIIEGVSEGDEVVTSGNFLIDSESRLRASIESSSQAGHKHGGA